MRRSIPPLNSLRSFEAAARNLSFTLGAAELNVSPGAVSRQVRLLEAYLGRPLFERGYRQVALTPLGEAYAAQITELFGRLEETTDNIFDLNHRKPLHVWCPEIFALRWLLPRLPGFYATDTANSIELVTSESTRPSAEDIGVDKIEVAIRLGDGAWPNLSCERLVRSELVVVCSPRLLADGPPLLSIEDIANHTLLVSRMRLNIWEEWLSAAGLPTTLASRRMVFESSSLAYQAAIEGMGLALGQAALVSEDRRAGRLVTPLNFTMKDSKAFYLMYPSRGPTTRRLRRFRDWIIQEARQSEGASCAA
jgi:LysR family glycine cleavage system transcriptional activator